ncbi:MAG: hypothetical protein LC754_10510 [Acidobacteria bacterium]|nr:hypothetical protein [Acidobacteriota bacterium]
MAHEPWTDEENQYLLAHPTASGVELRDGLNGSHGNRTEAYTLQRSRLTRADPNFSAADTPSERAEVSQRLGRIADLLERSGIDPQDIGRIEKVRLNEWEGMYKDADGEAHKVDMSAASLILTPTWETGPEWPVLQPGTVPAVTEPVSRARPERPEMVAVILPDLQIGYFRDVHDNLTPTHDERAISIALQVVRDAKPDRVVLIGDALDLCEISRYRKEPAFARTTQAAIDRAVRLIVEVRSLVSDQCQVDWIEGNHEVRLQHWVKDNAAAAFGLRQGNIPESWPVLSVPTLCRLDELRVTYHAGYPSRVVWLNDRLKISHGDRSGKNPTLSYLDEERASTIIGHHHKRMWSERTRETRYGPRTIMAACPGCLCRTDGAVPSARGGTDLSGVPVERWEDWQQGLAVVTYDAMDGPFAYEPVPIHDQRAFWRGAKYYATRNMMGVEIEKESAGAA